MQLSIAKDIFGVPWGITASGLQQFFPVAIGMINGAIIQDEPEPKENIPFAISADSRKLVAWSQAEEDLPGSEEDNNREKVVHVLPVRGVLMKNDMACGPVGTKTLAKRLAKADSDPSVIGHVMIMETPGGAVNSVPVLVDVMKSVTKPIEVWVDGMMGSSGTWIGSYGDEIMASRETDLVGCIGTMLIWQGRISKSKEDSNQERQVTIYADDAYEKNEEYETAINNFDFKLAKAQILNPHNELFVNEIKANRPGVEDKHLHGRTFQAGEVIGSLVDSIGTFDDAVNRVIELSNYKKQNAGSNGSQATSNNQTNKSMDYPNIQNTLGIDTFEVESDGRRTFTTEEMEAVDTALAADPSGELQTQLTQATSERDQATADLQAANDTLTERDQTITDLQAQVANLESSAGAVDPKIKKETDAKGDKGDDTFKTYASAKETWDAVNAAID